MSDALKILNEPSERGGDPVDLLIDDPNTGDDGRPLGTYAEKVKARAREILRAQGVPEHGREERWRFEQMVTRMYERHVCALPSYRQISRAFAAKSNCVISASLNEDEIRYLLERLAGVNDPDGQAIVAKLQSALA